jgi:single-stranded DNA-binding protein
MTIGMMIPRVLPSGDSMAKDINITVLSGSVATTPSTVLTRNNKKICLFNLKNVERYQLADGRPAQHDNYLTIEVLGRNVDKIMAETRQGDRLVIHGYLRVDDINGVERVRIRAFHIEKD